MKIGKSQEMTVLEQQRQGYTLGDDGETTVFLPRDQASRALEVGTGVQVFIFTDREGAPVATMDTPKVEVEQFACLEVVDVTGHGTYLDWGLTRDLYLPFGLQQKHLRAGDRVVVGVGVDDYGRIYASSKLGEFFDYDTRSCEVKQEVDLLVYDFNDSGVQVVIDGRYSGILYYDQTFTNLRLGDTARGWITFLRDDGRIDVALQQPGRRGTDDAKAKIWAALLAHDGFLALTDKSSPTRIRGELQMSKKAFKKAIGALYKERKITLGADGIRAVSST